MSRTIKFRVWQESSQCYLAPSEKGPNMPTHSLGLDGNLTPSYPWATPLHLEQYIGRKDKNNKEIYEGDIVRITYEGFDWIVKGVITCDEIIMDFHLSDIRSAGKKHDPQKKRAEHLFSWLNQGDGVYVEVVGNIHQNKDVLEKYEEPVMLGTPKRHPWDRS